MSSEAPLARVLALLRARLRLPLSFYLIPGGCPFAQCSSSLATLCALGSRRQATTRLDSGVGTPLSRQPRGAVESAGCPVRAKARARCTHDQAFVLCGNVHSTVGRGRCSGLDRRPRSSTQRIQPCAPKRGRTNKRGSMRRKRGEKVLAMLTTARSSEHMRALRVHAQEGHFKDLGRVLAELARCEHLFCSSRR